MEGTLSATFFDAHTYRDVDEVSGAETIEQLQARTATVLNYVQAKPHDTILLVGDGAFGRALRRVIQGHPHLHEYTNPLVQIPNAELVCWV